MKKITVLLLAFSVSICATAQITIKGTVSSDSIPLESAHVIIKNSAKGIATDSKGYFEIEAKKGDTLSVSYLGYETKEIVVIREEQFVIQLEMNNFLDEVVVKAYDSHTCRTRFCCGLTSTVISYTVLEDIALKLYPNPSSSGIFQLALNDAYNEVEISVANISGQTIRNIKHEKFGEKLTVDLSQFSAGLYILNIIADGNRLEPIKAVRN